MEQPFYIGQKVIAIWDVILKQKNTLVIKKGEQTTIKNMIFCCQWSVDIGFKLARYDAFRCTDCNKKFRDGITWIDHRFFAPVQESFEAITFERVMEEEKMSVN